MADLVDVAEAVKDELNNAPTGTFSQVFQAVRKYRPTYDLKDLKDIVVTVVPKSNAVTPMDRRHNNQMVMVDIGIQKKLFEDESNEAIDPLMDFVQEIIDYLSRLPLAGAAGAKWKGITNEPAIATEHLEKYRSFTSVVTLTYEMRRP